MSRSMIKTETETVLGIDLGGTNLKSGIVNREGDVLQHSVVPTHAQGGRQALLEQFRSKIDEFKSWCDAHARTPSGIGIGTAGYVDPRSGTITYATSNLPGWTGLALQEELERYAGIPVTVANDAHTLAIGEAWLGAGRAYSDFFCITLGTGIGGARIIDGGPDYGGSGYAGGIGHMIVALDGLPCNCGSRGCYEQYGSVTALLKLTARSGIEPSSLAEGAKTLFDWARAGHEAALSIVDQYAGYVAAGIVNVLHLFNPNAVVVGGAIAAQGDFLLKRIADKANAVAMPVYRDTPIVAAELGERAGVVGAARLAWSRLA